MTRLGICLMALLLWAIPLEGVVTLTEVLAEPSTLNQSAYQSSGAFAVGADDVVVCVIGGVDSEAVPSPTLTWTTGGESWTAIGTIASTDTFWRLRGFVTTDAHASSTLTATFASGQVGALFRCYKATDVNNTSPVIQFKGAETLNGLLPTVTMDSALSIGSVLIATVWAQPPGATDCVIAAEAGYTLGTATDQTADNAQSNSEYAIGAGDTTPMFTLTACSANTDSLVWAVELDKASSESEPPPATGGSQRGMLILSGEPWR